MSTTQVVPATPGIFARASSGLVRTVSTTDTVYYGLNAITIAYVTFTMFLWPAYPGASYEWSTLLVTIGAIGVGIVYALLAGVYPRSGGEYVFLSRIVRPELGFVISFIQAFWYTFYFGINGAFFSIYGLSPLFSVLGLQLHNQGLTSVGTWFASGWGIFVGGALVILLVASMVYFGMHAYFRFQRWGTMVALGSVAVTFIVLILGGTGVLDFQSAFNSVAGGGAYAAVTKGVVAPGFSMGQTLNFMVWPAFSILFSVNMVSFSGEIKNVRRGPLMGIVGAMVLCGAIFILFMVLARFAMGNSFLIGSTGSHWPLASTSLAYVNATASILAGNWFLTIIINLWVILIIPYALGSNVIYASRALLAWAIDGVAPTALSNVSARRHSPFVAIALLFVFALVWLSIYAFTSVVAILSGLLTFSVAFCVTSLTGLFFPWVKREVFERSPAAIRVLGLPLISIAAVVGVVFTGFLLYRCIVDQTFGANTTTSIEISGGALVAALVWFYVARFIRQRQGVAVDKRFREIPVE
ncbi:MAG TPA: APC family permease [Candidatus Binatia bacterium]|nr:APC family permease [Candidatus Binatia bacterium]